MKNKKTITTTLTAGLLLFGFIGYTLVSTGFFREFAPTVTPVIRTYEIPGVEDMALSEEDSFLILSSDDRAAKREGIRKNGALYFLDLTDKNAAPVELTGFVNRPFYPHGISLFKLEDSRYRIWTVNHPTMQTHQIEVFDLHGDSLAFLQTINSAALISPNDLVALDSSSFYLTNDHGYTSGFGLLAEDYLGLPFANVCFYDGKKFTEMATGISYANGITYDADLQLLYVASPRKFTIKVYRATKEQTLTHVDDLYVATGIDNLHLDRHGTIWTGGHPDLLRFTSYAKGNQSYAPSEVLRVTYRKKGDWNAQRLFIDDGSTISGASVAIPWGANIFIGNVMDEKLIVIPGK